MNLRILLLLATALPFAACSGDNSGKSRGPIVLGDSASIVTETDPAALQDQVIDLNPVIKSEDEPAAATAAAKPDTAAAATTAVTPPATAGLNVSFKEITITIPGITTRSFGKPDLQKARGATYELTGGSLAGAQLRTSGGTVSKVTQRYETVILLQDDGDKLPLESLGKYTSDWQPLTGTGGAYSITGLEASKLGFKEATPAAIRNAVQIAARKKRLSKKDTQDWIEAAQPVHAVNQPPFLVVLRSVSWRIDGKDAAGKTFNKELRIDVPLP